VYPALSVLDALGNRISEILWIGSEGGMEFELVSRRNLHYRAIPAAGLHGVGLRSLPGNFSRLVEGTRASRRILAEFQPDVLFFTGGYVAAPMAYAGRSFPITLYVPDIEPGLALKFLARFADSIALTAEESKTYFKRHKKTVVTGYPIRSDFKRIPQAQAKRMLGLAVDKSVILVYGGSKGARSINQACLTNLPGLLADYQVVHLTGQLDWESVTASTSNLDTKLKENYFPFPYLHEEMGTALAAADLVVCRAGASTLGELPFFDLPAILIPYPYTWRYQKVNADHLVNAGGAVIIEDENLQKDLPGKIRELLSDKNQVEKMVAAMGAIARPDAASRIANLILETANKKENKQ
jgi:UDP-N-acetylglucosamine--N-acetylmuramyl-(pentapeptide) pyrophosphoryl-undecaprenol N-acetylglucosamine transferase